jgi:hypothetical protein
MPEHAVSILASELGSLSGKRVAVLGISYRGGVKESAFSGVFPTVDALKKAGATVLVHDPMYTDEEITSLGFTTYKIGTAVDGVILQADHAEYKKLMSSDFPGVKALVDGRRSLSPQNFEGVAFRVIGAPAH